VHILSKRKETFGRTTVAAVSLCSFVLRSSHNPKIFISTPLQNATYIPRVQLCHSFRYNVLFQNTTTIHVA